ncbi:hypothetical protein MMC13_000732 [Lambiella insularis]|nr:hypothetical protein [Lambiella insularis]
MPAYAVLGATGTTGQELIKQLSASPKNTVNAYVRSRSKLEKLVPSVSKATNISIFEGSITDIPLLSSCFTHDNQPVQAILSVIGASGNIPNYRGVQDTAHSIVAAMCSLRSKDPSAVLPKIIFLTSQSTNHVWHARTPQPLRWLLSTGLSELYADLEHAQDILRLHSFWLRTTIVQPGGLSEDIAKGYKIQFDRDGTEPAWLSYPDLAAGMIEIAKETSEKYDGKDTTVVPSTNDVKFPMLTPLALLSGLVWHYAPWAYWLTH